MNDNETIYSVIHAYELGLADAYYSGTDVGHDLYPDHNTNMYNAKLKMAYDRGYQQGMYMYCKEIDRETIMEFKEIDRELGV